MVLANVKGLLAATVKCSSFVKLKSSNHAKVKVLIAATGQVSIPAVVKESENKFNSYNKELIATTVQVSIPETVKGSSIATIKYSLIAMAHGSINATVKVSTLQQ